MNIEENKCLECTEGAINDNPWQAEAKILKKVWF